MLKGAPRILFIIIYRPPKYSPAFVEEFTELLSMISSEFDCFAIAGDFNIHIDNAEIKTTKEMITVLNTFDLIQHVHGPTHNRGHTLDLLISRGLNISSIVIKDVALSDHFCIFFDILISVSTESRSVSVRKRCINENTSVLFMKAISLTPSISADSVDLLLDSFDSKVKNVIDDIAPIKVSKKNGRQKSFWRKSTAVQNMKRQCRKAERMWRKTKLEIHYSIYKDSLHAFNLELATARQTFFSNLINSNLNNTRTLFATVERLTNPPSQIPSEMLSDSKCNEFASFFSEKISNIRKEIGTSSCNTGVTQIRQQSQKEVTMSVFKTIDSKILEEIVQHLKSSTCYLDTLPTSFFKSVLNCLEADLLEVVNTSLLSGTFPNSLKTSQVTYVTMVPRVGNETLRPLGVATGNALSVTRSEDTYEKTPPVGRRQPMTSLPAYHNISAAGRIHHQLLRLKLASEAWLKAQGTQCLVPHSGNHGYIRNLRRSPSWELELRPLGVATGNVIPTSPC